MILAFAAAAGPAHADDPLQVASNDDVLVRGHKAKTVVDRLPQPLDKQPQTVTVIDSKKLKQQAASTLDQAVRNVPGITANTGEGGGATAGDQFRIRGFDAQNDISTDGLRDFGSYTRDSFDIDSVEVFLGPTGSVFGRGSFGGEINSTSKFAKRGDFGLVTAAGGSASLARGALDVNREIGESSAVRFNLMAHQNEFAGIDGADSHRWGAAASFALGLGEPTTFLFNYFHQTDHRTPYYGVPVSGPVGAIAQPLPVDRSTFYGTDLDRDRTNADVVTAKLSHDATDWLELHNDTRVGVYSREFLAVAPSCSASTTAPNPNAPGSCVSNFFDNNPATAPLVVRGGASGPYFLDQWGVQNVTTAIANTHIAGLKSQTVAGLDIAYEYAKRSNYIAYQPGGATFPRPAADPFNPNPAWNNAAFIHANTRTSNDNDIAGFASEQLWLTNWLSVLGGVRWERFHVKSDLTTFGSITTANASNGAFTAITPTTDTTELTNNLVSPRASVIFEPGAKQMYYVSWARSAQPATGTSIANVGTPITAAQTALDPTTSEIWEVGGRLPLFSPKLILNGALFDIKRDNAKDLDPITGAVLASGDKQEAKGFQIGLDGAVTDRWTVTASYTYLDTKTLNATINCGTTGAPACGALPANTPVLNPLATGLSIPFAARNSATLWTTYAPTRALTIGGGVRYTEAVWLNNTHTARAPDYVSVDAMASYAFPRGFSVQLNATNLLDRDQNYDQVVTTRAAHAPGRTFVLQVSKSF